MSAMFKSYEEGYPMASVVQDNEISTKAYVQNKYSTSYFYFYPDKSPLSYTCY